MMELLRYIERTLQYAYILHDKDFLEDGTPEQPHYHVVLGFANARNDGNLDADLSKCTGMCKTVSNVCGRTVRVEGISSISSFLQYMTHTDMESYFNSRKSTYSVNDIRGTYGILKHRSDDHIDKLETLRFILQEAIKNDWSFSDVSKFCLLQPDYSPIFRVYTGYYGLIRSLCESNLMERFTPEFPKVLQDDNNYSDDFLEITKNL